VIKAEFSASLRQSSESHDPSEITLIWWSDAQETYMIIISVENSSKDQHLIETQIFCYIINVTFD